MPYARGYVFGFVDALARSDGMAKEAHTLALISVAHAKMFGNSMRSVFIVDSQSNHSLDSATKGRATGEADLKRCVADNGFSGNTPSRYRMLLRGKPEDPVSVVLSSKPRRRRQRDALLDQSVVGRGYAGATHPG
jgi:hypothetical protein